MKINFCPQCANKINEGDNACTNCGKIIRPFNIPNPPVQNEPVQSTPVQNEPVQQSTPVQQSEPVQNTQVQNNSAGNMNASQTIAGGTQAQDTQGGKKTIFKVISWLIGVVVVIFFICILVDNNKAGNPLDFEDVEEADMEEGLYLEGSIQHVIRYVGEYDGEKYYTVLLPSSLSEESGEISLITIATDDDDFIYSLNTMLEQPRQTLVSSKYRISELDDRIVDDIEDSLGGSYFISYEVSDYVLHESTGKYPLVVKIIVYVLMFGYVIDLIETIVKAAKKKS